MTDTSVKRIAPSLSTLDYVEIIRAAAEAKLSVFEYLLMKLRTNDSVAQEKFEEVTRELLSVTTELNAVRAEFESFRRQVTGVDADVGGSAEEQP